VRTLAAEALHRVLAHFTLTNIHHRDEHRVGLTSKPRHAQRQKDALRGSLRPRLASTCNHSPLAAASV